MNHPTIYNKALTSITTMNTRRPKFQHAQTPRILNLPFRPKKKPSLPKLKLVANCLKRDRRVKLKVLFDQEREFTRGLVLKPIAKANSDGQEKEKIMENWKVQVKMLRAKCKFLKMERDVAVKKMESWRVMVERTLRSALHDLLYHEKQGLSDEKNCAARTSLQEKIQELAEILETLLGRLAAKDLKCQESSDFDRQASVLQSRLERLGGDPNQICTKEIREMDGASFSAQIASSSYNEIEFVLKNSTANFLKENNPQTDVSRRKMKSVSKGTRTLLEMLKEDEEYPLMLSASTGSARIASPVSEHIVLHDMQLRSTRHVCEEAKPCEEKACSGFCKAIVQRVIEQVRAETEQWHQMHEKLEQVRDELEELQASRDFWEARALESDVQIQSLSSSVQDWKQRTLAAEATLNELQTEISTLRSEIKNLEKEKSTKATRSVKNSSPNPRATCSEKERQMLLSRSSKENRLVSTENCKNKEAPGYRDVGRKEHSHTDRHDDKKCLPLQAIRNSSPMFVGNKNRAAYH